MMLNVARKDFLLMANRWIVLGLVVFAFIVAAGQYPVVSAAMLFTLYFPFNIAVYDDKYNGQKLISSLPVKRKEIIHTRYIEGIVFTLMGYVLGLVETNFIEFIRWHKWIPFSMVELFASIALGLLLFAIFYPFNFAFGMASSLVAFAVYMVIIMFERPFVYYIGKTGVVEESWFYVIVFIGVLILYGLSYILSLKIYQKKDF